MEECRSVYRDEDLGVELTWFKGISLSFPAHFHDYYVIGVTEGGVRQMTCGGQSCRIGPGDVNLFHPGENHDCVQSEGTLDYRGIHIPKDVMSRRMEELTGSPGLPRFSQNRIRDPEIADRVRAVHTLALQGGDAFEKEEQMLLLLSMMLERYGGSIPEQPLAEDASIEAVCAYLRGHFQEKLRLEDLCGRAGMSKSTLLRAFTRAKGITPYRYLESLRVNAAKTLLAEGVRPGEAALRAGFSDQSHFTNQFLRYIGVTPGAYRAIFRREESTWNRMSERGTLPHCLQC